MKLCRRQFLHLAVGAAALAVLPRHASALDYPTRPVRIVVGFDAGSALDVIARLISQQLSERLGQQFVVENRPGAAGNIGTEVVVRASADGYTLLLTGSVDTINATLYQTLHFNFIHDIVPVAGIARLTSIVVVHPSFPAKTISEFIAYARANPGKINMASAGTGTPSHLSGELFEMMSGINMVHVPYHRGGPGAFVDLLGGQVQVFFAAMPASIGYVRAGKLRALAVTTIARSEALPDVPTVSEFLPGYEASGIIGLGAPRNTSAAIIETLNKEVNASLTDAKFAARVADLGGTTLPGSPADFGKIIADEVEKWAKVIRVANIKPD